eukprot:2471090-Pleurochrysis_carterae.AAC.1
MSSPQVGHGFRSLTGSKSQRVRNPCHSMFDFGHGSSTSNTARAEMYSENACEARFQNYNGFYPISSRVAIPSYDRTSHKKYAKLKAKRTQSQNQSKLRAHKSWFQANERSAPRVVGGWVDRTAGCYDVQACVRGDSKRNIAQLRIVLIAREREK